MDKWIKWQYNGCLGWKNEQYNYSQYATWIKQTDSQADKQRDKQTDNKAWRPFYEIYNYKIPAKLRCQKVVYMISIIK